MHALIALMEACHSGTQLALYEQTVVEVLMELLERSEDRLRLVALLAVALRQLDFLTVSRQCECVHIFLLWQAVVRSVYSPQNSVCNIFALIWRFICFTFFIPLL